MIAMLHINDNILDELVGMRWAVHEPGGYRAMKISECK